MPANLPEDLTLTGSLEFAVATEENGEAVYTMLAEKFADNAGLADMFAKLAKDEQFHRRQFSLILETVPADEGGEADPDRYDYLKAMAFSSYFRQDGPLTGIENVESAGEALAKVLGFEKATLGFYQAIQDLLGDSPQLADIIEAEKGHITAVAKYLIVEGSQFRGLGDKWH